MLAEYDTEIERNFGVILSAYTARLWARSGARLVGVNSRAKERGLKGAVEG